MKRIGGLFFVSAAFLMVACSGGANPSTENTTAPTLTDTTQKAVQTVPTANEDNKPAYGFDLSHFQGKLLSMVEKNKNSLAFVICKATDGAKFVDPMFKTNWKEAKDAGLVRGAYHFYRCNVSPETQAASFISQLGKWQSGDLPPIIDFEEDGVTCKLSNDSIQRILLRCLVEVERLSGKKPLLYTDRNMGKSFINNAALGNYDLYIADIDSKVTPFIPNVWKGKTWKLWQRSDTAHLDGVITDMDKFNGSVTELKEYCK